MPIGTGHVAVGLHEHRVGRHDVEHGERQHRVRMVECHAMAGAAAAIMADDVKAFEAERAHEADLVGGHRPEGVIAAVGSADRLRGIAVAAQVGTHHGEVDRKLRRDLRPHRQILRIAVQ